MTSGGAHRRDAAAAGPVGHRSLGDLEEERDLARAQQAAAHAAREQAVVGQLLEQCLTVPNPLHIASRRGASRVTAMDHLSPCARLCARRVCTTAERGATGRSEEHTSELQSLMRISYAVFCLQ